MQDIKILANQIQSDIDDLIKDIKAGYNRNDLLIVLGRIGNKVDNLKQEISIIINKKDD